MEQKPSSNAGFMARVRHWRERRKRAARERRGLAEQRINSERYRYSGDGAPGGPGL
jgi:hypothetical protein